MLKSHSRTSDSDLVGSLRDRWLHARHPERAIEFPVLAGVHVIVRKKPPGRAGCILSRARLASSRVLPRPFVH